MKKEWRSHGHRPQLRHNYNTIQLLTLQHAAHAKRFM